MFVLIWQTHTHLNCCLLRRLLTFSQFPKTGQSKRPPYFIPLLFQFSFSSSLRKRHRSQLDYDLPATYSICGDPASTPWVAHTRKSLLTWRSCSWTSSSRTSLQSLLLTGFPLCYSVWFHFPSTAISSFRLFWGLASAWFSVEVTLISVVSARVLHQGPACSWLMDFSTFPSYYSLKCVKLNLSPSPTIHFLQLTSSQLCAHWGSITSHQSWAFMT